MSTKQRLNLVLPRSFHAELTNFADQLGYSPGGVVRWMFGVSKLVADELHAGNRVMIAKPDGTIVKEIAVPR